MNKSGFDTQMEIVGILYIGLAIVFLCLAVAYLFNLKIKKDAFKNTNLACKNWAAQKAKRISLHRAYKSLPRWESYKTISKRSVSDEPKEGKVRH